jgi:hypothetical protein
LERNGLVQQFFLKIYLNIMSTKGQNRYLMGFRISQNLGPLCFHKLCQFHKFQMFFKAFGKIIVRYLKKTFNYVHHLQM